MSTAVQTTRNPLILNHDDDDIAAWAWGNRRRRSSFNLLGQRRIFGRRQSADRTQAGDSSAGLVMFLAGLVVGAILSTIYFGYTSNNQSIGGGLKELTRQVENATVPAVAGGTPATDNGVGTADTEVPGTAAVSSSTDYSFYDNLPKAQEPTVIDSGDTQVTVPEIVQPAIPQTVVSAPVPSAQPVTPAMTATPGVATQTAAQPQPIIVAAATTTQADTVALATIVTDEQASRMTDTATQSARSLSGAAATGSGRLPASSTTAAIGSTAAATSTTTQQAVTAVTALPVIKKAARRDTQSVARTKGMTNKGEFYMLQLASYSSYAGADKLRATLAIKGIESLIQKVGSGEGRYRVRMGPFIDYAKMTRAEKRTRGLGLRPERKLERHRG